MFLSAVARPRFDELGNCTFDGKIGMWPFVKQVAAQRASVNRPRGTMVTTGVKVTKQVYADMVINNLIPAIRAKWPDDNKEVFIQHDNASSHFSPDYLPFRIAGTEFGWNITLTGQPANSPDTNINDLGFFRALQARQWDSVENAREDTDGLILAVTTAFQEFEPRLLNYKLIRNCEKLMRRGVFGCWRRHGCTRITTLFSPLPKVNKFMYSLVYRNYSSTISILILVVISNEATPNPRRLFFCSSHTSDVS
jgi:hypothetical protein